MGGFLKSIAQLGATGAATAFGGPAAGAAAAAGMGMLGSAVGGGSLGDILMGGAKGAGGAYLGGKLATPTKSILPPVPGIPSFTPNLSSTPLLDALSFNNSNTNPFGNMRF